MATTIHNLIIAAFVVTILRVNADSLCLKTGLQCSTNCEDIILCPTRYADPMKVLTCESNKLCTTDSQGKPSCSADTCEMKIFTCTTNGAVPDPKNASSYYMCPGVNTRGTLTSCDQGKFFNTTDLHCYNDTIPYKSVDCDSSGTIGTIDTIKRFCYICDKQKIPLVYPCNLDTENY